MRQKCSVIVLFVFAMVSFSFAEDRFETFFSPTNSASFMLVDEPGRNNTPDIVQMSARGTWIASKSERNKWTVSGLAARTQFEHSVLIPPTGPVFPDRLSELSGGIGFLNKTDDRRLQGVNVAIGSASDQMFQSIRETEINITGSAMRPSGPTNAWIFLFNYSNNRPFLNNIPLPGVAYMWFKPKKGFRAIVGFPFMMVRYQKGAWTSSAALVGSTNYSASLARRLKGPFETYLGFERSPQQWLRAGRDDNKKRLIYDENKFLWGFRGPLSKAVTLDGAVGRTFTRRLFEAKDATHDASKVHLDEAWLFALKLNAKWGK